MKMQEQQLMEEKIEEIIFEKLRGQNCSLEEKVRMAQKIYDSMCKEDPLALLMQDDTITEIIINGLESVYVKRDGQLVKLEGVFKSQAQLEDTIQSLISDTRAVNEVNPILETRLPDGSVAKIILPPISKNGPCMTIHKVSAKVLTISEEIRAKLEELIRAKRNIFVCGRVDSGKTALVNRLLKLISQDERVITIENRNKLEVTGLRNLVRLEGREFDWMGGNAIDNRKLLETALSMSPERIVLEEVSGNEMFDVLYAMNAGKAVFLAALPAKSISDMLEQMEYMILQDKKFLSSDLVQRMIASAVDVVIRVEKLCDGSEQIMEITEVEQYRNGKVESTPLYVFKKEDKCM